jgi:SPP1 gp7 family putative phage head morphogenesis protein
MTVGPETLRLQAERTVTIRRITDDSTRSLVRQYTRAWDRAASDLEDALLQVASSLQSGDRLTLRQMNNVDRFQAALARLAEQLDDLAAAGRVQIVDAVGDAVSVSRDFQPRIIASQLPASAGPTDALAAQLLDRVAGDAFDAIVARAEQQIVSAMRPVSAQQSRTIADELVRGITVGDNPRAAARRMLQRMEAGFAGGLTRTEMIARTEMLDAMRAADQMVDTANQDVVNGWQWFASLDERTCVACIAMHGQTFPISEPGPEGHHNCRCTRLPVVRPWAELGFDVPEPPSQVIDGETWFGSQPAAVQTQIAGRQRLDLLANGDVRFTDFAKVTEHPGWRPSRTVTPVRELIGA